MAFELRPMGVGDILDVAFRLYKSRFLPFLTTALILYVPYGIAEAGVQSLMDAPSPDDIAARSAGALLFLVAMLLFLFVVFPLGQAAMMHQVSASYLGEDLSGAEAYRRAAPRLGRLLLTTILVGLVVMVGMILFVVPGIIFMLWFLVASAIVVLEGLPPRASMKRSRELVAGNLKKALMLSAVLFVLSLVVGMVAALGSEMLALPVFPDVLLQQLAAALVFPIQTAAVILFYYDLRIRKEGFDLERLAAELGKSQPAAVEAR